MGQAQNLKIEYMLLGEDYHMPQGTVGDEYGAMME
jgi:hypothetical protein